MTAGTSPGSKPVLRALSPRIARVCAGDPSLEVLANRMVALSKSGLSLMYRPERGLFAFTRRKDPKESTCLEGESLRYTAIVLLGAVSLDLDEQRRIFGGFSAAEQCGRLLRLLRGDENVGDLALLAWAAAELQHSDAVLGWDALRRQLAKGPVSFTVELAWVLSALVAARWIAATEAEARRVRDLLCHSFRDKAQVFPHFTEGHAAPWGRAHVSCFADQVYPIQALARFHHAFGDAEALHTSNACAARIVELQGEGGQWWWHYNARNGSVVEGYPVYSVHQDAMAPMALLDLAEAGGDDHSAALRAGLRWMERAPEVGTSLVCDDLQLIWRKVARGDPAKAVRRLRAGASRVHPRLRLRWLDTLFPPTTIDHESRPYHLGWILHAWMTDT